MTNRSTITKTELGIATTIIATLLGILGWFVSNLVSDIQSQNKEQWKHAAMIKDGFREDLAKLRERVSFLEGSHNKEKK